jgi:hypothetical protein
MRSHIYIQLIDVCVAFHEHVTIQFFFLFSPSFCLCEWANLIYVPPPLPPLNIFLYFFTLPCAVVGLLMCTHTYTYAGTAKGSNEGTTATSRATLIHKKDWNALHSLWERERGESTRKQMRCGGTVRHGEKSKKMKTSPPSLPSRASPLHTSQQI